MGSESREGAGHSMFAKTEKKGSPASTQTEVDKEYPVDRGGYFSTYNPVDAVMSLLSGSNVEFMGENEKYYIDIDKISGDMNAYASEDNIEEALIGVPEISGEVNEIIRIAGKIKKIESTKGDLKPSAIRREVEKLFA